MNEKILRITHVVTYASRDGAFGGPLAVALEQTRQLAAMGHDVELVMGWDGELDVPVPGVAVRLFKVRRVPGTGFSGLFSPAMQSYLRSVESRRDVVHIHLGRDLVTAPAARRAAAGSARVFLQTHGMVMPDRRLRARLFDWLYIRPALSHASSILTLTPEEEQGVATLTHRHTSIDRVTNGVSVSDLPTTAQVNTKPLEVLFLARLHPRKRVLTFARAASMLTQHLPTVRFSVVGPDEGDLDALRAFISTKGLERSLFYEGPVSPGAGRERIANSSVYVLPSLGEVVPMSVLEALAVGTPTIITRSNGLAKTLEENSAAMVVGESASDLADAMRKLVESSALRADLAAAGLRMIHSTFSAAAVARKLDRLYRTPV